MYVRKGYGEVEEGKWSMIRGYRIEAASNTCNSTAICQYGYKYEVRASKRACIRLGWVTCDRKYMDNSHYNNPVEDVTRDNPFRRQNTIHSPHTAGDFASTMRLLQLKYVSRA